MGSYRPERIATLVHREVADRLRREVKDPRMEPISITRVEVPRDLGRALIHFTPLGGGEPSSDLIEALKSAAKKLRGPVGRALRTRNSPELVFRYDANLAEAFRVTDLLTGLENDRRRNEESHSGEE